MADTFETYRDTIDGPLQNLANITPNDSADLANFTRALYLGAGGDVQVDTVGGQTLTVTLSEGWHPIRVRRVYATSTTATGLIAGW